MLVDFDVMFKSLSRAQKIIGTSNEVKRDKKWYLQFAIIQSFLSYMYLLIIYNMVHHNVRDRDYSQFIKNGVVGLIYLVVTFEYGVLLYYAGPLLKLTNDMKLDYRLASQLPEVEQNIVLKYALQGRYVCKQWLGVAMGCPSSFLLKSLFLMAYYYYKNDFKYVNFYELVYPAFIENYKDNFSVFLLTYFAMGFYGYYAGVVYVAYVPFGPLMMLHACGQLELIKHRIDNLFAEHDSRAINEKLKGIVKQLQYVNEFVETIQSVFMIAYELTLRGSALLLPFALYEVIEAKDRGELSMEFISFIIGGTLISSTPCYYSDLLMEKGEEVRLALYSCGWEVFYDRRARSTMVIMLTNALQPIAIHTVFRTLCLDALTDLFQQSYAIFNLINAT